MPPGPGQPQGAALKMGVVSSPCSPLAAQTDHLQPPTRPAPAGLLSPGSQTGTSLPASGLIHS